MNRRRYIRLACLVTVPHWVIARSIGQPTELSQARAKVFG